MPCGFSLRNKQALGYKFRRQHPLGGYILDFYCRELRLAIEVDGAQHYEAEGGRHDETRTQALEQLGVRVLRFTNLEILHELDSVLLAIGVAIEEPSP